MDLNLKNKIALITGASKGIGAAIAETFAAEGVNLYLTARNKKQLEMLKIELQKKYSVEVKTIPLDLTEGDSQKLLFENCKDINILINNAGDIPSGSLFDIDEDSWRRGWELKVFGYINLCRGFYPIIKKNEGGVIINNIGNGGEIYDPLYIAGAAGNSSLMSFTKALGGNSLEDNIRVIGVNPGPVETERIYKILKNRSIKLYGDENHVQELLKSYPLGRPAHVREISDLIAFLVSEKSGYTSGTVFTVDGGISSRNSII
ncbi:MAG: SDR family oxidoreductase [SAR324 cluster bacterium]|jgi:short-subunit dehydrogenase|nr:SDR family oxidoreductase [SAR324 cluster bacterium]